MTTTHVVKQYAQEDSPADATFDLLVKEHELRELDAEQKAAVMKKVHEYAAHVDRIAVDALDGCHLLTVGGNLDYYAGLEYDRPIEEHRYEGGPWIRLYESPDGATNDTNVGTTIRRCLEALGLPVNDDEEEV